jgi:hypothetical protein
VLLEDLDALVQKFPADLMLDQLDTALDPEAVQRELADSLCRDGGAGPSWRVHILSYKPTRRCAVSYQSESGDTIFGKCLPFGVDLEQARIHREVAQAIRTQRLSELHVPGPQGSIPAWNMLCWRQEPGSSVHELLETSSAEESVGLAAYSLAGLHRSQADWSKTHGPLRELETLRMWVRTAALTFPEESSGLSRAEEQVRRAAAVAPEGRQVPSHRDFYDKQILIHQGRAAMLDLETASRAEPELDVANFLAHLHLRDLQNPAGESEELEPVFLDAYCRRRGALDWKRLTWYRASSLLRLACVYSLRPRWGWLSSALREESLRTVTEVKHHASL